MISRIFFLFFLVYAQQAKGQIMMDYLEGLKSQELAKPHWPDGEFSLEFESYDVYKKLPDIKRAIHKVGAKYFSFDKDQGPMDEYDLEELDISIISPSRQVLFLFQKGRVRLYLVSTGINGQGEAFGSLQTPRGAHFIHKKIGEGLPAGSVFIGRVPTGRIWEKEDPKEEDLVLTRVLPLDGVEERNKNSLSRYIYIHGTNHPDQVGTPVSHGCIRMEDEAILEYFEAVKKRHLVYIMEE